MKRRPKGRQRPTVIRFRTTYPELKLIREFAEKRNVSISDLLRKLLVDAGALPVQILDTPLKDEANSNGYSAPAEGQQS